MSGWPALTWSPRATDTLLTMPATGALVDPELRGRNDDLGRERQRLIGPAQGWMRDANTEALGLRLTELDLGFGCG